ncbi:MAG: DUF1566 domain-containing protein [Bacteroidetes bacterium]|nr:DUF1566 domain-containing protein [Bacteroidota bacterium]
MSTTACEKEIISPDVVNDDPILDETTIISNYQIVHTGVTQSYDNNSEIALPTFGASFYGQDANHQTNMPSYTDNGDGTITDNITGLMWEQSMGDKISFDEAFIKAADSFLGKYNDWRVPTVKELYSLIQFTGQLSLGTPIRLYIDENYFDQPLGNESLGERNIDAQTWSSTEYVGKTMNNDETVFGVNFIDGRIKGYPKYNPGTNTARSMYFRMVRGNTDYGNNNYVDNGNGTISDLATGLMWQKNDNETGANWEDALSYAQSLETADYDDWRLPNAKELQSIVDYSRSLQTTNSAAINQVFTCSAISDPENNINYGYYWSSTTHLDGNEPEASAVYVCFGEGQGFMNNSLLDVHGAGAQRSDPKSGNASDFPQYFGPQGDVRYVYNLVRCVRTID